MQLAGQMQSVQFRIIGTVRFFIVSVKTDFHAAEAGEADGGIHIQQVITFAALHRNGGAGNQRFAILSRGQTAGGGIYQVNHRL